MAKILLGFMGAGKTTVGRILDPKFHDMDELIVEEIGMSINDYFAVEGEAAFRRREAEMLERLLENEAAIISPGGGIVVNPHNRALLEKNPHNIYLRVDFETLYSRIQNDKAMQRPLFLNHTKEEFKKIFDGRLPLYEDIATHIVDVEDKTPEEIANIIFGGEENYRILHKNDVEFKCTCSKERYADALVTLGKEELEDIAKQETTELVCAFCKEKYHFSQNEITELLDNLK